MKLGKSKFAGDKKEIFKIKDGDNVFRVLPPMGNLAELGVWSKHYRVCWGYKDSSGRNRPFVSPRVMNFNTKMVEVDCAAFNRTEKLKRQKDELVKKAKEFAQNRQPIPEDLKKEIEKAKELVMRFNIDSKHHMNVMSQDDKIGLLKLANRGMTALRTELQRMEASGVDATGVEGGRFMIIHREGTGLDTAYSVKEYKEQVQTEEWGLVDKSVPHTLTSATINRLDGEAFELDNIYPMPTPEEVAEIVAAYEVSEIEGSLVVDRILGAQDSVKKDNTTAETKVQQRAEAVKEAPVTQVTEAVKEVKPVIKEETPVEVTEVKPVEVKPVVKEEVETKPVMNTTALDDDAFLKELGINLD